MLASLQRTLKLINETPSGSDGAAVATYRDEAEDLLSSFYMLSLDEEDTGALQRHKDRYTTLVGSLRDYYLEHKMDTQAAELNGANTPAPRSKPEEPPPTRAPRACVGCGKALVIDATHFVGICNTCGHTVELIDMQVNAQVQRSSEISNSDKEMQTVMKMVKMIQGEVEGDELGKSIEGDWPRIEAQLKHDFPHKEMLRVDNVRHILTNMAMRKYCKIAPYIYSRYSGRPKLILTPDEIKYILTSYADVLRIWKTHQHNDAAWSTSVRNLPNCCMIIYELVDLSSWKPARITDVKDHVYQLEPNTVNKFRTGFWHDICAKSKRAGVAASFQYRY